MGDFNCDMSNVGLKDFCKLYNLKNLIPTCFKNVANPTCLDLLFRSFENFKRVVGVLWMSVSVVKTHRNQKL